MILTNEKDISIPLAVWLLTDDYDYNDNPNVISATSLLKPIKQLVLAPRVDTTNLIMDVSSRISSRYGTALHDSIEKAWNSPKAKTALKRLGLSESVVEKIRLNPDHHTKDEIPVYMEKRTKKELDGYTISGKFDFVYDGKLIDFKSTSVFSFTSGSKEEDYILQGSIYRWLNPGIITSDHIYINYLFTDWSSAQAKNSTTYPDARIKEVPYKLLSLQETEQWLKNKIAEYKKYKDAPENTLPDCTEKELWRTPTVYKYYSDPSKTDGRATKNFDKLSDANKFKAEKGKGVVLTIPGQVKACGYCPAFTECTQKDQYDFT